MWGLLVLLGWSPAAGAPIDDNDARLVTELVTTALATEQRLDVVSSVDVRRQLELEADKQSIGCDASSPSCLAEIAGAMGAGLVVYGSLGHLGDLVILTLNLFDSTEGRAAARVAVRETGLAELSGRVDGAVRELTAPYVSQLAEGSRTKLLVLDIEPPRVDGVVVSAPSAPPSALFWGGAGGFAGGVVVLSAGVVSLFVASDFDTQADDLDVDAGRAAALYGQRDIFAGLGFGGLGVGAALAVGGGVLIGLSSTE